MGVPALQHFEHLTAEVEARSDGAARAAEVVSISLGKLVKSINIVVGDIDRIRVAMIEGRLLLDKVTDEQISEQTISDLAKSRVLLKRFSKLISRPMLARPTGTNHLSGAEALEATKMPRTSDGRLVRRLARRIRESAEPCEWQRKKLHKCVVETIERLDQVATQSNRAMEHEEALMAELVATTKGRHPVINAYLAR